MSSVRTWTRYLLYRLGLALLTVWGIGTLAFVALRIVGNPVTLLAGPNPTPAALASVRQQLGLNKPIWEQYISYLSSLLHGNLGRSAVSGNSVGSEIVSRLPATAELLIAAGVIAVVVSLTLSVLAARAPRSIWARISNVLVQLGSSMPMFWVGLILVYFFYFRLSIAPAPLGDVSSSVAAPDGPTGMVALDSLLTGNYQALGSALSYLALPAITLAFALIPTILQASRDSLHDILASDYIRTARACGMPWAYTYLRYAARNAAAPVVNIMALVFGYAVGATVIVEVVFSWPGIGLYSVTAMTSSDYAPVLGIVIVTATVNVLIYLLADVLSAVIDPRIVLSGRRGA